MSVSVCCSGLLALWMSTMPDYHTLKLIYFLLAVTHFAWSPYIKCVRMLGTVAEQGRLFGMATMIEGTISTVLYLTPTLFWGDEIGLPQNFRRLVAFFGVFFVLTGLALARFFDYKGLAASRGGQSGGKTPLRAMGAVVRMPATWLMGLITFASYASLGCLTYISPYLNTVFTLPVAWAAAFGVLTRYGIRAVASPLGGLLRDRLRGTDRSLILVSGMTICCFLILIATPQSHRFTGFAVCMAVIGFFGYMLNANAPNTALSEMNPPEHLVGLIIGVSFTMGSFSNLCVPPLAGMLLDRYGDGGYRLIFAGICMTQFLLAGCGLLLRRMRLKGQETGGEK